MRPFFLSYWLALLLLLAACESARPPLDSPQALYAAAESLRTAGEADRALAYYRHAAAQSHPHAQLRLSQYYHSGGFDDHTSSHPRDPSLGDRLVSLFSKNSRFDTALARQWYERAVAGLRDSARAGDADALFMLGFISHPQYIPAKGAIVEEVARPGSRSIADRDSTLALWRRAARRGHARALDLYSLEMLQQGRTAEAMQLHRQMIVQGHKAAYETLADAVVREHFSDGDLSSLAPDTLASVVRTLREGIDGRAAPARKGLDRLLALLHQGAANGDAIHQHRLQHLQREGLLDDSTRTAR